MKNTNVKEIIKSTIINRTANYDQTLVNEVINLIDTATPDFSKPFTITLSIRGTYAYMGFKTIAIATADTYEEANALYKELNKKFKNICDYRTKLSFSFATTRALTTPSSLTSNWAYKAY